MLSYALDCHPGSAELCPETVTTVHAEVWWPHILSTVLYVITDDFLTGVLVYLAVSIYFHIFLTCVNSFILNRLLLPTMKILALIYSLSIIFWTKIQCLLFIILLNWIICTYKWYFLSYYVKILKLIIQALNVSSSRDGTYKRIFVLWSIWWIVSILTPF